ncbi:MAG: hypothetical protein KIT29_02585 [Anaerolineales bacterium]|nr:hypothetical protein [Anaerolineales bacterium]
MFDYEPVPAELRTLMLDELQYDAEHHSLYLNPLLKPDSTAIYLPLLLAALEAGTSQSFGEALAAADLLLAEHRYLRQGRQVTARLPANYAHTVAAGEFNRYYMRAVCRDAIQQGAPAVELYRAKAVSTPRHSADERIGRRVAPDALLADLRQTNFEQPSQYGLGAPNSGLSIRRADATPPS